MDFLLENIDIEICGVGEIIKKDSKELDHSSSEHSEQLPVSAWSSRTSAAVQATPALAVP